MSTRRDRRAAAEASNASGWTAHFQGIDASEGLLASVVPDRHGAVPHDTGVAYRLHGIGYDARADAIAIDVGEPAAGTSFLRYFVAAPRSIKIDKLPEVTMIEIRDSRGERRTYTCIRNRLRCRGKPPALLRRSSIRLRISA